MNTTPPDGGPAFPTNPHVDGTRYNGMSLRDWFAGMAMQGILSAANNEETCGAILKTAQASNRSLREHIANNSYGIADAMLVERQKGMK